MFRCGNEFCNKLWRAMSKIERERKRGVCTYNCDSRGMTAHGTPWIWCDTYYYTIIRTRWWLGMKDPPNFYWWMGKISSEKKEREKEWWKGERERKKKELNERKISNQSRTKGPGDNRGIWGIRHDALSTWLLYRRESWLDWP